ncbi:MAG: ppiD [Gammaproteobacteria bacterium]|jgi:peptidyl-prolyl cis-trans isomerase D|nr:ppiD [Gammaproteobacteria bacterium]
MRIRDHTHGWIATGIISLLILSFALWGIHSYIMGGSASSVIAKVNGIEISKTQFTTAYERLHRQMQMQSHSELSLSAEKKLRERVLQELIYTQVLKQDSLKQGYRISSRQIDDFLESMPQFQVKGQFSQARFQQAMFLTLYSIIDFLELIKTTLLIDQPRLGTIFTSFSLPNEVEEAVALVNQEREIQYATLSLPNKPMLVSQEEIRAYYQQHAAEYKTPEQVSVEYLELTVADLEKKARPTSQELKNFYNENATSFVLPGKNNPKNAEIQPFEKVEEKVKSAFIRQKAEEQFANAKEKLANLTYENPDSLIPAAKELDLPIKTTGPLIKDKASEGIFANNKVREAAFSHEVLNLKNNSDVIQVDPNTFIVMRVKSYVPAALMNFDMVQKQILVKLQQRKSDKALQQRAADILKELQSTTHSDLVMRQYHLNWVSPGVIGRHSTKIDSAILDAAFSMPRPENKEKASYAIAKIPTGYAVIALKAVKEGVLNNKDEYRVFAEQIQNSQGLLEYELYKDSVMKQAKIVIS